jgi:myo-inositol-1(or 4)-monophosphatase
VNDAELAAGLVEAAGREAAKLLGEGLLVERKSDHADVVTAADLAAERIIVEGLREHRPHDSILGEEGSSHAGTSGRTWIIDPVDGTWNFVHGMERWCSALALAEDGQPVLGAIHHPRAQKTYAGGRGVGATCNGRPIPTLPDARLPEVCVATYLHPPYLGTEVGLAWQRAIADAATIRMFGSASLDLVSRALGQVGAHVQHSLPDWDWFPGAALVASVGGVTRKVTAAGVEWSVAGAPTAVQQICEALAAPMHRAD